MDKDTVMAPTAAPTWADRFEQLRGSVFGFVFAVVGDPDMAREIVAEVFAQAEKDARRGLLPAAPGDGSDEGLRGRLFGLACRRAIARVTFDERDAARRELPVTQPDRAYDPVPFDDPAAEGRILLVALGALGRQDAACLLLSVVEGFSVGQIASMLELPTAEAKKRLMIARRHLRDAYFTRRADPPAA